MMKNESISIGFIILLLIIVFLFTQSAIAIDTGSTIAGVVFNDTDANGDGIRNMNDERGIADIEVSNGINVTITDESGY